MTRAMFALHRARSRSSGEAINITRRDIASVHLVSCRLASCHCGCVTEPMSVAHPKGVSPHDATPTRVSPVTPSTDTWRTAASCDAILGSGGCWITVCITLASHPCAQYRVIIVADRVATVSSAPA
jgi:hypothetical protein